MPVKKLKDGVLKKRIRGDGQNTERDVRLQPWADVKTIGILYHVQEEPEYVRFTTFVSALLSERKEVRTLGMIPEKEIPHYCYPKLYFDYFSKKDLNWFGKPCGNAISDFTNIDFDLLINLDFSDGKSFEYIVVTSRAKLKAGIFHPPSSAHYDLMISMEAPIDYEVFLNRVKEYIQMLCPSGHK